MPPHRGDVFAIAKKKSKKVSPRSQRPGVLVSLYAARRKRSVRIAACAVLLLGAFASAAAGLSAINEHVTHLVMRRSHEPRWEFQDLPAELAPVAQPQLEANIADLFSGNWMDPGLCKSIADRLESSGWVARVNHVRRRSDALFQISCRYRLPFVMVQQDRSFFLVDREGVRLPGAYAYDSSFKLIQGVKAPSPDPGGIWPGEDVQAGLDIIARLEGEPFKEQLSAVLVQNFKGRADARQCHIELATDRPGGRIRWGSAPGLEIDENKASEKLAILRENYRQTGRLDADHPVIDIVTFPDRYTIPG